MKTICKPITVVFEDWRGELFTSLRQPNRQFFCDLDFDSDYDEQTSVRPDT